MTFLSAVSFKYQGVVRFFVSAVILSSAGMMVYTAYLLYYPFEPVRFESMILDIATSHVDTDCSKTKDGLYVFHPGDIVPLRIKGEKFMNTPGLIMPRLVDTTITLLPDYTAIRRVGKFDEVSLTHRIPRGISPGMYYFDFTVVYEVNPLRKITDRTRSVPFWVESKAKSKTE